MEVYRNTKLTWTLKKPFISSCPLLISRIFKI